MRHVADIRKEADFRCRTCPRAGLVPPTVRNNARPADVQFSLRARLRVAGVKIDREALLRAASRNRRA